MATKGPPTARPVARPDTVVGIARTLWNAEVVGSLYAAAVAELLACGVALENIYTVDVPGAFELPHAAQRLARLLKARGDPPRAVIALGCLIKGDTQHFEYIAGAASHGLMDVSLKEGAPVVFGVLTVNSEEQARVRAGLGGADGGAHAEAHRNHGTEWAQTAVRMSALAATALDGASGAVDLDNL